MAFEFGQFNEFSDSVTIGDPVILAVAKAIQLGPFKGAFYQAMGAPETTIAQKSFEVYTRSKTARSGVIGSGAGTGWDADDTADLAMTAGAIKGLTVGHVLKVGSEVVIVKSVDRAANNIDVYARGAGATTAAAHADATAFTVVGYAGADTDLKNVEAISEATSKYTNYVQTVFEVIEWTKHATLVRKGLSSAQATALLLKEAEIRVAEMLATMAVNGVKQVGSTADRYMSAGLLAQIADTNSGARPVIDYNVGGLLTEAAVMAAIKEVFDAGGTADTIWCSPTVKGYINAFNAANSALALSAARTDHTAGMYISALDYEGHILRVRVDADIPNSELVITNMADCKKGWLENDGLRLVDEPSASSREIRKSLQGSVGFLVENVGHNHTRVYGITGGSTERVTNVVVTNTASNPVVTDEVVE